MKNIKLIYRLLVFLSIFYVNSIQAQENTTTQLAVTFNSQSKITDYGLFFGNNFQFGPRITPHGDCINVVNGFAFVGWYRGDMDDRSLMLSRKDLNDPNSEWVTVEFPHSHYGFRHNRDLGDSHKTISVGISTFDNRVHLIYDLHAYTESKIPNDFFNYSVSEIGGAFVPDEEFNLSLFENENTTNAKLNYLKQGQNSVVIEQNISEATRPDVLQFFISESLSTNEFSKDKLSIYPNPSSGVFNIETNLRSYNYRLISIQGKVLEEGVLNSKALNFSKYARGLYLLQLASNAGEIVEKIVIK